jgi:hypothetical protein
MEELRRRTFIINYAFSIINCKGGGNVALFY